MNYKRSLIAAWLTVIMLVAPILALAQVCGCTFSDNNNPSIIITIKYAASDASCYEDIDWNHAIAWYSDGTSNRPKRADGVDVFACIASDVLQ